MSNGDLTPLRTIKLTIAYEGTAYAGWQFQPGKPTVQETLEKAIEKVTGRHASVLASGRTDAGVHALGQVVGFRTESALPPEVLRDALNANLPHDVAVLEVAEAPDGFRPTHHEIGRAHV
jgi:tRNA pseudouridine38-40 synthase